MTITSNMADISVPSINTRTSLLKSAKASSPFIFLYACVGGIGKFFKPKTRSFFLTLSSQLVFKYHLYFMAVKSNLENFSLCGITPNHSRLVVISGNTFNNPRHAVIPALLNVSKL